MLTKKQRDAHAKTIGASDASAILGVNPYMSAYDVWLRKTGKVQGEQWEPGQEPEPVQIGVALEPALISWAKSELGKLITDPRKLEVRDKDLPFLVVHPDALVLQTGDPVEAKTSGFGHAVPQDWGEPGTGQVPEPVCVQAHVQMRVTLRPVCHVPTWLKGRGRAMFHVERNGGLLEVIAERLSYFWRHNVQGDIPPEDSLPSLDLIRQVRRVPKTMKALPPALIESYAETKAAMKDCEKIMEEMQARVLAELGNAEASEPTAAGQLTFMATDVTRFDSKRFRAEHPDLWEQYKETQQVRRLLLRKAKEDA